MLDAYRVLDLTDERALLAGRMLADFGADVVQVEPPGGSSARRVPPFVADDGGPDASAYWLAYAAGKRGVTCNIDTPAGRDLLLRMVKTADFVLESDDPGAMAARGLDYDALAHVNPAVVVGSVTGFGQDGPKAAWAACDLTIWAAGGPLRAARDGDRVPIRVTVPQSWMHAAADLAGGVLIAHTERVRSGRGQHVDVSAQQSVAQATLGGILAAAVGNPPQASDLAASFVASKWQVADGFVELVLVGGPALGHFTNNLFRWMADAGAVSEDDAALDWRTQPMTGGTPEQRARVAAFVGARTKQELLEAAIERKLMLAPVATVADLSASPQAAARGFFRTWPDDEHELPYLAPPVCVRGRELGIRRPAPTIGQHNAEVYGELGVEVSELRELAAAGTV